MVKRRSRGFTLVELVLVMAIMGILLAIAVPHYRSAVRKAQESVLHDDLFQMRSLIQQYTLDKQEAPQSLDDLVSAGYLHALPKDPFTNSNTTWTTDEDDSVMSLDQSQGGIVDVHSGSTEVSTEGTAYNTW